MHGTSQLALSGPIDSVSVQGNAVDFARKKTRCSFREWEKATGRAIVHTHIEIRNYWIRLRNFIGAITVRRQVISSADVTGIAVEFALSRTLAVGVWVALKLNRAVVEAKALEVFTTVIPVGFNSLFWRRNQERSDEKTEKDHSKRPFGQRLFVHGFLPGRVVKLMNC
jgi:hypothetical protein